MKYIGIEGSSYVGKTSVGEELEDRGHILIPEYDTLGPFPVSDGSYEGLKSVVDELLLREVKRTQVLGKTALNCAIFSDRTPLSFITFEDMKIRSAQKISEINAHRKAREYLINELNKHLDSGDVVLPDSIAVLRLSTQQAFTDRVNRRGITGASELASFDTQALIAKKAIEYSSVFIGTHNTYSVDVDNSSIKEVADFIENIV